MAWLDEAMADAPRAIEAERAVLWAVINYDDLRGAADDLTPEDFYADSHRELFAAIRKLWSEGETVDPVTISAAMGEEAWERAGRFAFLASMEAPLTVDFPAWVRAVQEAATRRVAIVAGVQLVRFARENSAALPETLDRHLKRIDEARSRVGVVGGFLSTGETADEADPLAPAVDRGEAAHFGLPGLDAADLLFPGTVTTLAARPGHGKTAFALQSAAASAVDHGQATAYLSLEMDRRELFQRILSARAAVNYTAIRRRQIPASEMGKCRLEMRELRGAPLYTDDRPAARVEDFGAALRKLHRAQPTLRLAVVDYLGLIELPRSSDPHNARIGAVTRELVRLARELHLAILLLVQLGRRNEQDKRPPLLTDLADSDVIGRDSYAVLAIDRRTNDEGVVDQEGHIAVLKHRGGLQGQRFKVRFQGQYQRFIELSDREEPPW